MAVTHASMAHSFPNVGSRAKAAVLMSPKVLQAMFGAGHARKEQVRKTKNGKQDKNKLGWVECWHVTGNIKIDGKMSSYDFTVAKKSGGYELYDLRMK